MIDRIEGHLQASALGYRSFDTASAIVRCGSLLPSSVKNYRIQNHAEQVGSYWPSRSIWASGWIASQRGLHVQAHSSEAHEEDTEGSSEHSRASPDSKRRRRRRSRSRRVAGEDKPTSFAPEADAPPQQVSKIYQDDEHGIKASAIPRETMAVLLRLRGAGRNPPRLVISTADLLYIG